MRLSLRKRKLARSHARDCYLETKDEERFKELMAKRLEPYGLDPATIATLIIYAIKLWLWWKQKKTKDPGVSPMRGEPRE